ncbi:SurA N-terminal domain-containing protein [Nonomuraea typhae]|uniref:SurA N-terminal domain-containing protein n=1 Tax=Nonomuraea typhae TaxID=2603600 RepID=A0ABW7YZC9_9ACTN
MRTRVVSGIAALGLAAAFLTACASDSGTGREVVATVNGAPIVQAELERAMNTARAGVAAANGGAIPADRLRAEGLALAVREKVLRLWAREEGLIEDVGEAAFAAALAAENRRREQARASGRPLPGVPSYDVYTFAGLRAAELRKALADRLDLPADRVRAHYAELVERASGEAPSFAAAEQRVRLSLAEREITLELDRRVKAAEVSQAPP